MKTLASKWSEFSTALYKERPVPVPVKKAIRSVFYCGALALLECMNEGCPSRRIDDMIAELERFQEEESGRPDA